MLRIVFFFFFCSVSWVKSQRKVKWLKVDFFSLLFEMSCPSVQSFCYCHNSFDLFLPSFSCLCHTSFNSDPTSPSHQMREKGHPLQRKAISSVNVATAPSLSFSHHFTHKCFSSFFSLLSLISCEEYKGCWLSNRLANEGKEALDMCSPMWINVFSTLLWHHHMVDHLTCELSYIFLTLSIFLFPSQTAASWDAGKNSISRWCNQLIYTNY